MRANHLFLLSLTALPTALTAPVLDSRATTDGRFTLYDLPTALTGPCDLEVDPNGQYLWGIGILKNIFFRINPSTGHVDEYPIPATTPLSNQTITLPVLGERTAFSCAIRKGADGNLYAGNGDRNQLTRINPTTHEIKIFEITPVNPLGNGFPFNDLFTAKDGIWLTSTTGNTFSFFSFATEKFETHTVPTPAALPVGVYVASNGVVYICEVVGNQILTYNPATKAVNEYPLPVPLQGPVVTRVEKNGYVYFTLLEGNGLGRINMTTHKIDLYHTNQTGSFSSEDTLDSKGGVWISSLSADELSRFDTTTGKFSYLALPNSLAMTGLPGVSGDLPPFVDVPVNYGPGDAIWFSSISANQVGRYNLTGLY